MKNQFSVFLRASATDEDTNEETPFRYCDDIRTGSFLHPFDKFPEKLIRISFHIVNCK